MKEKGKKFFKALIGVMLALTCGIAAAQSTAVTVQAEDEVEPPKFEKTLTPNGDGTYTISLSVTGTSSSSTKTTKANVIVVMDLSGSMNFNLVSETGRYGCTRSDGDTRGNNKFTLYKYENNQYVALNDDTYDGTVYYYYQGLFQSQYVEYTGTRYSADTRLEVAKSATNILADTLLAQNTKENDMIELQLITFSTDADTEIDWTDGKDSTAFKNSVNDLDAGGGTNWDAALYLARNNAADKNDDDDTYIIFVSDGNPTYYVGTRRNGHGHGTGSSVQGDGENTTDNEINAAKAEATAIKNADYNFYGIGVFGNVTNMQDLASTGGGEYYAANDEETLKSTFAKIASSITNAVGYENVTMTDAITNLTATSLVAGDVDENSFVYEKDGEAWADAPKASYNAETGVTWDLKSAGTLENGAKYTVSFRVWPSQEAYDLVADLNNGIKSFDDLSEDEQKQIVKNEDGTYALKSNPDDGFKASYTQVRTIETDGQTTTEKTDGSYESTEAPGAMSLAGNKMSVMKVWDHDLQPRVLPKAIGMLVYEDGEPYYLVILNEANGWAQEISIAPGIMIDDNNDGTLEVLSESEGHEYTVAEQFSDFTYEGALPEGAEEDGGSYKYGNMTFTPVEGTENTYSVSAYLDYHYDLVADPTHPMLDGRTKDNQNDFVDHAKDDEKMVSTDTGAAQYKATNLLKSGLNITKKVTETAGSSKAPEDAEFTYEITVTDKNGDDVWFSVKDAEGKEVKDAKVTGAEAEEGDTGFWSFKSGSTVTVTITADQTIRFINLPLGTDYSITEKETAGFTNTEVTVDPDDDAVVSKPKTSGKITVGDIAYEVAYTNNYSAVEVDTDTEAFFKKTVKNESGEEFEETEFSFTIKALTDGAPEPEKSEGTATFTEPGTETIDFGKITFTEAGDYEYEITEAAPEQPWVVTGSPAKVTVKVVKNEQTGVLTATVTGGEITNEYKPVVLDTDTDASAILEKTVSGEDFGEKTFTFTIAADTEGAPMPEKTEGTATFTEAGTKTIGFGKLVFTKEGEYKYTVTETDPGQPWIVSGSPAEVVIKVIADEETGELKAEITAGKITNTYSPVIINTGDEATAFVKKTIEGEGYDPVTFNFTITAKDNAPLPEETEGSVQFTDGDETTKIIDFGTVTYTEVGTYSYVITEADPDQPWVAYDNPAEVTVVVSVGEDGKLKAEVTGDVITNKYEPVTVDTDDSETGVFVTKTVDNANPVTASTFSFTLTEVADESGKEEVKDGYKASGKVEFAAGETGSKAVDLGEITYTHEGTYYYKVTEATPASGWAVTPESGEVIVTVKVTADEDGKLSAAVTGAKITNSYGVNPTTEVIKATKTLDGRELKEGEFSFTLTAVTEGAPLPTPATVTNKGNGLVEFNPITYSAAGTYKYELTEVLSDVEGVVYDTAVYEITVTVKDNGDGTLSAAAAYPEEGANFTNTFSPVELSGDKALKGTKTLFGRDMLADEKFEFVLSAADDATAKAVEDGDVVIKNDKAYASGGKDGAATDFVFDAVTFYKSGTYTFKVTETAGDAEGVTYDTSAPEITVTVVKEGTAGNMALVVKSVEGTAEFKNIYEADGEIVLDGKKTLKSGEIVMPLEGGEFTFEIRYAKQADAEEALATAENDEEGNIEFPAFEYTVGEDGSLQQLVEDGLATKTVGEDGLAVYTIQYVVSEVQPEESWYAQNTQTFIITVEVKDNGDGTLTVTKSAESPAIEFVNTYISDEASVKLSGQKKIEGDRPLAADEFTFTITADPADAPLPEPASVTNDADGNVVFSEIKFTKADLGAETEKVFTYTITESGRQPGVVNDSAKTVTVTVTDDGEGHIIAKVSPEGTFSFTFTNKYTPVSAVSHPVVKKALEGRPLKDGEFTFELRDAEGKVVADAANVVDGTVTFSDITFDKAGTYTFTVAEVKGEAGGVTYDEYTYNITATVTDAYDGKPMSVEWNYGEKGEVVFTNVYVPASTTAVIETEKTLEGRDLNAGEFQFELKDSDGKTVGTKSNDADGKVVFDELTFDKAGTYTYTITEIEGETGGVTYDKGKVTVTVTVTDDEMGNLHAEVKYGDKNSFVNTYKAAPVSIPLNVTKQLTGRELQKGEFSFELKDEEGEVLQTVTNEADGSVNFEDLTFEEAGEYKFTVNEVVGKLGGVEYDEHIINYTVTVTDNLDGTMTAVMATSDETVFNNIYTTTPATVANLTFKKTLSGRELKEKEFSFELKNSEGAVVETVTNDKDGKVVFSEMKFEKPGTYTFTVNEVKGKLENVTYDEHQVKVTITVTDQLDGTLKAEVATEGNTTFKNVYKEPETPNTGDHNNVFGWGVSAAAAIVIALAAFFTRRRYTA